ncbi:MAG: choice-of-anchor J domain-containing protein, partial [Bacteroidales bacterium]|nr:choice-of-anchor J domain-containing protein [Bacteroidales bacterium]
TDQENYYGSFEALAANELSQMALQGWMDINVEYWYREGFGLYEMGFRPDRTNLLLKLSSLGTNEPEISTVNEITLLHHSGNKDLMASFFESKTLLHCYFYNYYDYYGTYRWWQLLKHYYIKETDRIQLLYSTEHFDYYAATKENPYVGAMAMNMEEQFDMQEDRFNVEINHRINVCIYDNEVGKEINDRDDFQGLACGADKINTSHLEIGDYGLMNHEFMHALVNICSNHNPGPGQFLNEGLAESTDAFMTDGEMPSHRYKIQDLYYHYQRKYNRVPTFLEIVDNAEVSVEDPFWVDAYALGEMYWRYMNDKYPSGFWENVKFFLASGRDWSVFGGKTTEQEGAEFIQFMKELAFVGPPLESKSLPFIEDFNNDFIGWTTMRFDANDHWAWKDDQGINASGCALISDPYWLEEKDVDSWLVSPPISVSTSDSLVVSFSIKQWGQGMKPELYYTESFSGPTVNTSWNSIENIQWDETEGDWNEISFFIGNPPEKIFLGIRFLSNESNFVTYLIDNLSIITKGSATGISSFDNKTPNLNIYPNPLTESSLASFDVIKPGHVTLSIYNMQGYKLYTLFNKEVPEGHYAVPLNNLVLNKGIYLCRLITPDGIFIEKFMYK